MALTPLPQSLSGIRNRNRFVGIAMWRALPITSALKPDRIGDPISTQQQQRLGCSAVFQGWLRSTGRSTLAFLLFYKHNMCNFSVRHAISSSFVSQKCLLTHWSCRASSRQGTEAGSCCRHALKYNRAAAWTARAPFACSLPGTEGRAKMLQRSLTPTAPRLLESYVAC
jgi:hypothetical protein